MNRIIPYRARIPRQPRHVLYRRIPVLVVMFVTMLTLTMGIGLHRSTDDVGFGRSQTVQAQEASEAPSEATLEVLASDAMTDFPNKITFSLSAQSNAAPITDVQLLYGATRSDVFTMVDAELVPGPNAQATHVLDTQIYHMLPGTDITYRWLIRDETGNELESKPQTFVYHDDRFDWKQRTDKNVTVYWYKGNDAFGDELIGTAVRALENLQHNVGAKLIQPVKIYVYANTGDMRTALQSNEVEWVGGQTMPVLGLIIGAIAPGDTSEVHRIIPHELSHQVLHQATDNPYGGVPLWFEEGLAVYNQETYDISFDKRLEEAAETGNLISLDALSASFPTDPDQALLSYAQSRDVVTYIIDAYGTEAMEDLIVAFHEAMPVEDAIEDALGLSIDELDEAWRDTLPSPIVDVKPTSEVVVVAPRDRFAGEEVALPAAVATHVAESSGNPLPRLETTPEPPVTLLPGVALPRWSELGLVMMCCTGVIALVGVALLVALRLLGADKQVG